ncbi:hypothetical protein ACFOMD_07030 [Sphingoaurantiacus capsulatus]|uniref:EF-hand domain-containing protein n=1 Tax=Sphingoaurantiacus capsulatus TaxID=1771310 RepID=A0ABV7X902_9SPHN
MRSLAPIAFAAALMCGTSALAQTAEPATSSDTDTSAPATEAPATEATVTSTTSVETPAPMDASATMGASVTAAADTNWAQHDADRDGALTPLEFAMHVDAVNGALTAEAKRERFSRASGNGAIKLLNTTAADFSKADTNRDRKVDGSELAAWQTGGSAAMASTATPATGPAPDAATTGAGTGTPMPEAMPDDSAAPPANSSTDMTPATNPAPGAATTGAGTGTPIPEAMPDDSAAPPADSSTDMTPADPAVEPKQADDTMVTDTPPKN